MANHTFETEWELNKTYRFALGGTPLYEGKFKEIKGCWGTVEVTRVLEGPDAKYYRVGDTFEIKIALYSIVPV
ncbi:MAG: hypothetical protein NZ519_03585 [Bacteroidia bacterium]|nr:hypothetical protein [Bacteroidia bacterium]MDW8301202.1 hypothetical protein [Bacteroidia bacterium]